LSYLSYSLLLLFVRKKYHSGVQYCLGSASDAFSVPAVYIKHQSFTANGLFHTVLHKKPLHI